MIEKTFVNRVPTYPGRVRITPVAGEENTFDMERADAATVDGTPLDKATFNSIIHSRLTGRYYEPSSQREVASTTTLTTTPIPASGWVLSGTENATNGVYVATASQSQENPSEAFDGTWSTNSGWRPVSNASNPWIAIDVGSEIILKKVRIYFVSDAWETYCTLSGSNNGTSWTEISNIKRPTTNGAIDWSFSNSTAYRHYRLSFDKTGVRLYGWEFKEYSISTYRNRYTVGAEFPSTFTAGQIVRVEIPAGASTVGVNANTLNGVTVNTILQPSKRYELRYTGSSFVAKEV